MRVPFCKTDSSAVKVLDVVVVMVRLMFLVNSVFPARGTLGGGFGRSKAGQWLPIYHAHSRRNFKRECTRRRTIPGETEVFEG